MALVCQKRSYRSLASPCRVPLASVLIYEFDRFLLIFEALCVYIYIYVIHDLHMIHIVHICTVQAMRVYMQAS
jgi:hypothetical protein